MLSSRVPCIAAKNPGFLGAVLSLSASALVLARLHVHQLCVYLIYYCSLFLNQRFSSRNHFHMAAPVPDPHNPGGVLLYDPEEYEQMISRFRCQRTCQTCLVVCMRLDFGGHGQQGHHGCLITPCPHPLDIPMCWKCAKCYTRARSM